MRAHTSPTMPPYRIPTVDTDKPDAAMIPSLLAQAMQMTFSHRPLANASRPLANRDNYDALLGTLRSGLVVARTFYGEVRFDTFGQNSGKEPTTMQMDGDAGGIGVA